MAEFGYAIFRAALALGLPGVNGAFQSYTRILYVGVVVSGDEARRYGLFSVTGKSSSFIGPLIVGLFVDRTGSIRYGFLFPVAMRGAASPG
ncbi:vacuole effluxer Atg22 like-domain-containing protein [Lactarius pseudohatsudake]|nr:vacuole effluxer Atg22 like-domain-containing protein [Lactarius pseudohatsudake]